MKAMSSVSRPFLGDGDGAWVPSLPDQKWQPAPECVHYLSPPNDALTRVSERDRLLAACGRTMIARLRELAVRSAGLCVFKFALSTYAGQIGALHTKILPEPATSPSKLNDSFFFFFA